MFRVVLLAFEPVVTRRVLRGGRELFVARTLAVEPGAKVEVMGVASTTKMKLKVPETRG